MTNLAGEGEGTFRGQDIGTRSVLFRETCRSAMGNREACWRVIYSRQLKAVPNGQTNAPDRNGHRQCALNSLGWSLPPARDAAERKDT